MHDRERRKGGTPTPAELRTLLSGEQRETLSELERYGWRLHFVRHPLFQASTAVVFDTEREIYGELGDDGTLDEQPKLRMRHH